MGSLGHLVEVERATGQCFLQELGGLGPLHPDGIYAAEGIHLAGDAARVLDAGKVADHNRCGSSREVVDIGRTIRVSSVHPHLVAVVHEGLSGRSAEAGG